MKKTIFLLSIILFSIFLASMAQAVEYEGLVPCGPVYDKGKDIGTKCNFCHLLTLIERVINFALYNIALPLVVVFIVWGGLKIMTAGDDTGKVQEGRKIIQSAIIGIFIALGAWMIINMILSAIGDGSLAPWNWGEQRKFLKC